MFKRFVFLLNIIIMLNTSISCHSKQIVQSLKNNNCDKNKIILNDAHGVKDRKTAIEYYKSKLGYVHLDSKGNFESFTCNIEDKLTDDDLQYLIYFSELDSVHLAGKEITDKSICYFQNLRSLSGISLYKTNVTGSGFKYISDKENLTLFLFSDSPITDEGLKYLSEIKYNNPISELSLSNSKITDAGMPYIAKMKFGQGRINLSGTAVTDKGIKHLAGFKNMLEIFLYNTKVTDKGGKWLEEQLPNTTVYWGKHKPEDDEY